MRSNYKALLLVPALLLAGACKGKSDDASLNNDLTLAAQAQQTAKLDSITAAENLQTAQLQAQRVSSAPVVHHTTTTRVVHESAPAEHEVTKKNTNRDAAIGAVAGGILGATTSGNKVKGGIIGAAAGGILGGVIGNNVDVKKTKVPE
jgi:uncharacterized protein YcfJ